jgi:glycosyltransferase involved in cell wall biosynthesis
MAKKIFVFLNGPHSSSLILCDRFGINEIHGLNKPAFLSPLSKVISIFMESFSLRGYDLYFLEGVACGAISPVVSNANNIIVAKGNDHITHFMDMSLLWRLYFKHIAKLDKYITGVIAVSEMVKEDYLRYFDFDIKVAEGFIYRDIEKLSSIRRDEENCNFICIGSNPYLKGVDRSVLLFLNLKEKRIIPNSAKFFLLGRNERFLKQKKLDIAFLENRGVVFVGITDEVEKYFQQSTFQLHLARYEPNAVAIMEGMVSGVIPIISNHTGNRSFIQKIYPGLVLDDSSERSFIDGGTELVRSLISGGIGRLSDEFRKSKIYYNKQAGLKRWDEAFSYFLNKHRGGR